MNLYTRGTFLLKQILKKRRISYRDLGAELKLSEITIKRTLNNKDGSFNRIIKICNFLDIPTDYFFKKVSDELTFIPYTSEQKKLFVKDLNYFDFFLALRRNYGDIQAVVSIHDLKKQSIEHYLLELEKVGLVSRASKTHVTFIGNYYALGKKSFLRDKLLKRYLKKVCADLLSYSEITSTCFLNTRESRASKESIQKFLDDLKKAVKKFDHSAYSDNKTLSEKELQDFSCLLYFVPEKYHYRIYNKEQN